MYLINWVVGFVALHFCRASA